MEINFSNTPQHATSSHTTLRHRTPPHSTSLHATEPHRTQLHNMSSSIPELSVDTLMLERILEGTAVGETVPYGVLSKAIGRDVRNGSRHIMQSARERLLKREPKETRIVFEAVEGIGLKRLDSVGCVAVGDFTIGKIRRASKRGVLKVACADYDKLPKEDKIRFNAHLSLLGALHQATSPAQVKRLNAAVEKATDKLPSAEVLTLFTK